ncbi:MAG: IPT/TIG domain-containing protein [Anaerolineae bacterium]|nr:IPT/TIG domain-containing protein [Anaerolineae bacterium]
MDRRILICLASVLIAMTVLLGLNRIIGKGSFGNNTSPVLAATKAIPTIAELSPTSSPNNYNTTILITGTGFIGWMSETQVIAPPAVYLDDILLEDRGWVSSRTFTSTVPWGLESGIYTLTVVNPEGNSASLTNAFTVTQAIDVWTSNGPYGGSIFDMAVRPNVTSTIFGIVQGAGLFQTLDGGDTWQRSPGIDTTALEHIAYGEATTNTVYVSGEFGLRRSVDDGQTWSTVYGDGYVNYFAVDPVDENILYVTQWGTGVLRSQDGGQTWEPRSQGLTDTRVRQLLLDPSQPSTLYATTVDGAILKTINSGETWAITNHELLTGTDHYRLEINPHDTNVLWAMAGRLAQNQVARSLNGGQSWEIFSIPMDGVSDIVYHPTISTTLFAGGVHQVFVSTNGGEDWTQLNESEIEGMISEMFLDPQSGQPLYFGAGEIGFYRSRDGGIHWEPAVEGITGIWPNQLAAAPTNPRQVYLTTGAGTYYSNNGGQSWAIAGTLESWTVAVDPFDFRVAYVAGWPGAPNGGLGKTTAAGLNWDLLAIPGAPGPVTTLSVDPTDSNTVYAGGGDHWAQLSSQGWLARSDNGGADWQVLSVGHVISEVTTIAVDSTATNTLFIGACTIHIWSSSPDASGVLKSDDGGTTWEYANAGLSNRCVRDLLIHPENHTLIFAAANDLTTDGVGVFRSEDGGDSWTPSNTGLESGAVLELAVDPNSPAHLYAATWHGLFQSIDYGHTWRHASAPFGYIPVLSVSISAIENRSVIYVATVGGISEIAPLGARLADETIVGAGVYQFTVVHVPLKVIYLPLVMK